MKHSDTQKRSSVQAGHELSEHQNIPAAWIVKREDVGLKSDHLQKVVTVCLVPESLH